MGDVQEQIERLRKPYGLISNDYYYFCQGIADTLESQQARIEKLEAVYEAARTYKRYVNGGYRYQAIDLKRQELWDAVALAALQTDKEPDDD